MVRGADQEDINQTEFSSVLAACKLLKADFPTKDERWCRFYSKFIVMDLAEQNGPQHKRYSLLPTQIALFFLAMGTPDVKAKAICDLFLAAPVNKQKNEEQYEQQLATTILSKEQLKCIISIFVNISLVLLPMYASDYPPKDRRQYYKFLVQWTKRSQAVIDHFMIEFRNTNGPGGRNSNLSSRITMKQFVNACEAQDIFNVMHIRGVAKVKIEIEDANPYINRDSMLSKDLFAGRLSE